MLEKKGDVKNEKDYSDNVRFLLYNDTGPNFIFTGGIC